MNYLFSKASVKSFTSLIGIFIRRGKKNKALNYFLHILKRINQLKQIKQSAFIFLQKSLNNIYPELSFRRLGRRKVFYLPKIITDKKRINICMN
jgi:ribosomal protein S7